MGLFGYEYQVEIRRQRIFVTAMLNAGTTPTLGLVSHRNMATMITAIDHMLHTSLTPQPAFIFLKASAKVCKQKRNAHITLNDLAHLL